MSDANVCFLASKNALSEDSEERDLRHEFALEFQALAPACAQRGITLTAQQWDEAFDVEKYDAFMVGTVWDYFPQKDKFLQSLNQIETRRPVFNPAKVIAWNIEKYYLRELERLGAPSIPTMWADAPEPKTIEAAYDEFDTDQLVIKPLVGGGAWRQALLNRGEALPDRELLPLNACLIQPFLPSVPKEGEYSFLFFGGQFSHALQKVPRSGDYRVQSAYGARELVHEPRAGEIELCEQVLDAARQATGEETLLYARVDMVRGLTGALALMELEIIEPYLYPEQGPNMGQVFAKALADKLSL